MHFIRIWMQVNCYQKEMQRAIYCQPITLKCILKKVKNFSLAEFDVPRSFALALLICLFIQRSHAQIKHTNARTHELGSCGCVIDIKCINEILQLMLFRFIFRFLLISWMKIIYHICYMNINTYILIIIKDNYVHFKIYEDRFGLRCYSEFIWTRISG